MATAQGLRDTFYKMGFNDREIVALSGAHALGRAVQVDPINPKLKAPGTERLKLKYNNLLSTSGFKFNLRRYNWGGATATRRATW